MSENFLAAITDAQRNRRFEEIPNAGDGASLKLNIKADYLTIDYFDTDVYTEDYEDHIYEDVAVGEEEGSICEASCLRRYVYYKEGDDCCFKDHHEENDMRAEIIYPGVDFVKLAVSDLLYLCRGRTLGYLSIDSTFKKSRASRFDQEYHDVCFRNHFNVFDEWRRECERVPTTFDAFTVILRVTYVGEVKRIVQHSSDSLVRVDIIGMFSHPYQFSHPYELILLREVTSENYWRSVRELKTRKLLLVGTADDFMQFGDVNAEVRELSVDDILRLTAHYASKPVQPKVRLECRRITGDSEERITGERLYQHQVPEPPFWARHADGEERHWFKQQVLERGYIRRVYSRCLIFIPLQRRR